MDITTDERECGNLRGVRCNLSVTLRNMFTSNRIQKVEGYSRNIKRGGEKNVCKTGLAYIIYHTQALLFF